MRILQKAIVSVFFLIFAENLFSQDSLFVEVIGDTVRFWDLHVHEPCRCYFRLDVSLSNDTINITELDTTSGWADCMCDYDLNASITGLQNNTYLINVYRIMPLVYPDTTFFIGSLSFYYGGSQLEFNSHSYQSECYEYLAVDDNVKLPDNINLNQNYPNPFNPSTKISWQSPVGTWQTLKVYDVLGNEVAILVNEYKPAGTYEVEFNVAHSAAADFRAYASGIYIYQLKAGTYVKTMKMILIK